MINSAGFVELVIDNIIRGHFRIWFFEDDAHKELIKKVDHWVKLQKNDAGSLEFSKLTDYLFSVILERRMHASTEGKLMEHENEKKIDALNERIKNLEKENDTLKEHNKLLSEELYNYKTPPEKKDFQGFK